MPEFRHIITIFLVVFAIEVVFQTVNAVTVDEFRAALVDEGIAQEQADQVLKTIPHVYSVNKVRENIQWLRKNGVTDIGKVIAAFPPILGLSIEEKLNPQIQWLKDQGVTELGRFILSCTYIFGLSIPENLDPKIKWLQAQGAYEIGKIISLFPALLSYSITEKLNPQVDWLKARGVQDVGKMISVYPAVLGFSTLENLAPKLTEFQNEWGFSMEDIERQPMLLGASLKRIKDLRTWINFLYRVTERKDFAFHKLSKAQKTVCIQNLSAEGLLQHLKAAQVIHQDQSIEALLASNLIVLSETEKQNLISIFQNGDFEKLLVQKGRVTVKTLSTIGAYCQKVLE